MNILTTKVWITNAGEEKAARRAELGRIRLYAYLRGNGEHPSIRQTAGFSLTAPQSRTHQVLWNYDKDFNPSNKK